MARAASPLSSCAGVVAILVLLIPDDTDALNDAYVLLTVQPRTPTDSLSFVDLPEGMMNRDSNFAGVAAKEIEEKLGIVINQTELIYLTDKVGNIRRAGNATKEAAIGNDSKPESAGAEHDSFATMYPSKIFSCKRRVLWSTLHEWEGMYGRLRDGEMIALKVVPLIKLWQEGAMDPKALAAVALYITVKNWEKQHAE